MQPLYLPETMYALEKRWFEAGHPSLALMERAAAETLAAFEAHFGSPSGRSIAVACGFGNNAGDGYAFARLAADRGARVTLACLCGMESLHGDALTSARKASGLPRIDADGWDSLPRPEFWIDALFGIGLNRPAVGEPARLIDRINADHDAGSRVLSIDAPSGLNLRCGQVMGCCINADVTVTFHTAKAGHFMNAGLDACGTVDVRGIGLPHEDDAPLRLAEPEDAMRVLPVRKRNIHKGSCGHLLIVAGSMGMCGAARYAALTALRAGCGLVTLACPESVVGIMQVLAPGAMAAGLPDRDGALSSDAVEPLSGLLRGKTAVVVGPGLSRRAAPEAVKTVLESGLPAVIDADALNLIAAHDDLKALLGPRHLLTPHPGEAARLLGELSDPISDVKRLRALGGTALLKGASTLVCGETMTLCASGCGGMATGGSGDVLSGLAGALLAQGVDAERAGWAASVLHGLCGTEAAEELTETALTANDLIDRLPAVLKKYALPGRKV